MLSSVRRMIRMLPLILLLALWLSVVPGEALANNPNSFDLPADIGRNVVTQYGATPDDATDDTAALQAALSDGRGDPNLDYFGRPKTLFLPAGTYRVSDTLDWIGCCVQLQGEGSAATIIELIDNAPGFGDAGAPKPVIKTPKGNMSFRQNIFDLTIDVGDGNPGAVALDYISNNWGAIRGVDLIAGSDSGAIGLDMTRQWPGPLLVRDLRVTGFDVGIAIDHAEYGPVFEDIALSGQRVVGIRNDENTIAIRRLTSVNSVPALTSKAGHSSVIVLDSTLAGGAGDRSAIEVEGQLYARNISTSGYQSAIRTTTAGVIAGSSVSEYRAGPAYTLTSSPQTALNLPIEDLPGFHDPDLGQWVKFTTPNSDSAGANYTALQNALNAGKSTVYFAGGVSLWGGGQTLSVPAGVRRIVSFGHALNSYDGVRLTLRVDQPSTEPLIIEGFGYGLNVVHAADRTLVLKHGGYGYKDAPGAGKLFLDDVGLGIVTFRHTRGVWAWQLNTEGSGTTPRITNNGTKAWLFGVKTEGESTILSTINGGYSELLGTLFYPATSVPAGRPAIINRESSVSAIVSFSSYVPNGFFTAWVAETRAGKTRRLLVKDVAGRTLPLYAGIRKTRAPGELLRNGGFDTAGASASAPKFWTGKTTSQNRRVCGPSAPQAGTCALRLSAGTTPFSQTIKANLPLGGTLDFSAWAKGGVAEAKVIVQLANGRSESYTLALDNAEASYAQFDAPTFTIIRPTKAVKVVLKRASGKPLIDSLSLTLSAPPALASSSSSSSASPIPLPPAP